MTGTIVDRTTQTIEPSTMRIDDSSHRRRFGLFLALLSVFARESASQQTPFVETIEVRIATVDVVVTTGQGQHVEGLTESDFELLVDGVPQTITAFEEVHRTRVPVQGAVVVAVGETTHQETSSELRRRRRIVLFIDLYSLDGLRRNQAIASLKRLIRSGWSAGDQAMIALWNRDLKVPMTFTSDLESVERELEKVTLQSEGGLARDRKITEMRVKSELQAAAVSHGQIYEATVRGAYALSLYYAGTFAEEQAKRAEHLADALDTVMRGIAGTEGKKTLVIVGENFPQYPGMGMYEYVNELFTPHSSVLRMSASQMLASRRSLQQLVPRLTRMANANEITLHTIYSGDSATETPAEGEVTTTINAQFVELANTAGSFGSLSRETGGVALLGSRNFDLATGRMAGDIDHYYTLVWRNSPGTDGTRSIAVNTRDRSLTVRARRQVIEKSFDQQIDDRVVARLYQQDPAGDSPEIQVSAGKPRRHGRKQITVPVQIEFSPSLLTMLPAGEMLGGGFDIIVAASDPLHRLSGVTRKATSTSWRDGAAPPRIRFTLDVVVRDIGGMISVAVVDRWSKTTFVRRVAIPVR